MPHPCAGSSPSVSCQLGIPTVATFRGSPSVFWGSCVHRQKRLQFWNSPSSMTWTGRFDPLTQPKVRTETSLTRVLCLLPLWLKRLTWNLPQRFHAGSAILHSCFFFVFVTYGLTLLSMQMANISHFILFTKAWWLPDLLTAELWVDEILILTLGL